MSDIPAARKVIARIRRQIAVKLSEIDALLSELEAAEPLLIRASPGKPDPEADAAAARALLASKVKRMAETFPTMPHDRIAAALETDAALVAELLAE